MTAQGPRLGPPGTLRKPMSSRARLGPYFTEKLHPRNLLAQPGVLSASPRPFRNWTARPRGLCSLLRPSEQGQLLGGTAAGSEGAPATVPGFSGSRRWGLVAGRPWRGAELRGVRTHVILLALQLLPKLKLFGLQLVEGVPQLLGLVPGRGRRCIWAGQAGKQGPAPPAPPAAVENQGGLRDPPAPAPAHPRAGSTSACPR